MSKYDFVVVDYWKSLLEAFRKGDEASLRLLDEALQSAWTNPWALDFFITQQQIYMHRLRRHTRDEALREQCLRMCRQWESTYYTLTLPNEDLLRQVYCHPDARLS
ncbi:hypothetical protein FHS56_000264 [Thermonema lapsum]|jgi:hypothetical protein|uniref:Uncharacterized protein n=1 Tax=Thermonema lapsum TaxID=28195 RepID=A0A846MMK4_9BACT|nr:hypothetical protein [Thermonema lapsum]NIK72778.1 hypothetical protein [Thermonema lapsum]